MRRVHTSPKRKRRQRRKFFACESGLYPKIKCDAALDCKSPTEKTSRCGGFVVTNACGRWAYQHALCIAVLLSARLVAQAGHTTQIEVAGHLENDGRFHVVEIHHITIVKGNESDFRVFGL